MPIYEYSCKECGKLTDVLQKVNDPPPEKCAGCGAAGTLSKVVSRTSFVLKGGGWYSDLYGTPKKESKTESSAAGTSASTSSTSSGTSAPATSSSSSSASSSSAGGSTSSSSAGGDKK